MNLASASALACAFASASLVAQSPPPVVTAAQRDELFAVLDRFDPLDANRSPFVRVATGHDWNRFHVPRDERCRHGFLVGTNGAQFRVRYLEFDSELLTSTRAGTPAPWRVGYEPADLREFADALVPRLHGWYQPDRSPGIEYWRETPMTLFSVALLTARACHRAGHHAHCDRLLAAARQEPWSRRESLADVRLLGDDFANWLVLSFTDPDVSWEALLVRHQAWLQVWGKIGHGDGEVARCNAVARVLAHRRTRPPRSNPPSDEDLIEDLRDLCLPPEYEAPASPPPAHAQRAYDLLVARGLAAVPALIATLPDRTPTRSVDYAPRGLGFVVRPLGAVVRDVLVAIAGERPTDWQQWYAAASEQGLQASVRHALSAGTYEAALSWLRHWPDDLEPLFAAAGPAPVRSRGAIAYAVVHRGPPSAHARAREVLHRAAADPRDLRLVAAWWLMKRGDASGYRAAVADWRHGRRPILDDARELAIVFEVGIGEVWPAMVTNLDASDVRNALARVLSTLPAPMLTAFLRAEDGAFAPSMRSCLLRLLQDDHRDGEHLDHAEVAAAALHVLWPDEFPFDSSLTARSRARQIAWLRTRAAGDTTTPKPIDLQPLPAELAQTMAAIRAGTAGGAAIDGLAAFGMRALPLVEQAVHDLPPSHRHHAALSAWLLRLTNMVVEVTFAPTAAALTAADRGALLALRERPIEVASVLHAIVDLANGPAAANRRVVLRLARSRDGVGCTAHCELVDRDAVPEDLHLTVQAGSLVLTDAGIAARALDATTLLTLNADFFARCRKALTAKPSTRVHITFSLARE